MGRLVALIEPFYPKGERGRPPLEVELMLRVYFLQQWYGLADEALEDALHDSRSMRAFVGGEVVPDAITLLKFRYLLEAHDLTKRLLAEINAVLAERGAFLRAGAIMEATIIAAAPSTKNKELTLALEKSKAQMRALAEHPCHVVKNRFKHRKARYRGLAKNAAQLHTLFALANLALVGRTPHMESSA